NHLTVLVAQASAALARAGVDDPGRMLRPLLEAALDSALRAESREGGPGAIGALTGPVRRGDAGTVAEHVEVLTGLAAARGGVDVVEGSRARARGAPVRAVAAGLLDEVAAQRLLDVLAGSPLEDS